MGVKNIKEDIIYNIVDEVLKSDRDVSSLNVHKDDIVAYILNRTPPKYITSERGVLHGKLEARYIIQQKTDILLLLYEAIEVFSNRRPTETTDDGEVNREKCRFSHIFGEILEETTFTIVPDVEVSLLYKNKITDMIDSGWKNPYLTNKATMGFYHFWPVYDESMGNGKNVTFRLVFKHPNFQEKAMDINVELHENADIGKSHVVPIILMKLKEGVSPDFLYQ